MKRGKKRLVCGVDEAGRGPLAGPVIAAVAVFDCEIKLDNLTDSKLLTAAQRYRLVSEILAKAREYAVAGVSCTLIDKINILRASLLAMRRAVEKLSLTPEMIYVDGAFKIPGLALKQQAVVDGDVLIPEISAASIIAKVARDAYMIEMSRQFPEYGFEHHKGYGTKEHLEILEKLGPCPIHRKSFNPVSQLSFFKLDQPAGPLK